MNPTFFQFSAVIGQRVVSVSRNPIPKGIARGNRGGRVRGWRATFTRPIPRDTRNYRDATLR